MLLYINIFIIKYKYIYFIIGYGLKHPSKELIHYSWLSRTSNIMIDLSWRIELTSVILRKHFHLWNECEKIVCMKHGRPGDQWATVPRTMACPVTRTPWRLPGTESRRLGDVSVTPPVAMMDWVPLTNATYRREECSPGLRALEFSPSCQGRQRQGLEAGCHVASALEEQSSDCSPLSPHPAQGEALPREVGLPASTDLMKEITILHRCAQRFSWVILETVKVTLLTVIFDSWK